MRKKVIFYCTERTQLADPLSRIRGLWAEERLNRGLVSPRAVLDAVEKREISVHARS